MPLYRMIYTSGSAIRGMTGVAADVHEFEKLVRPFLPKGAKMEALLSVICKQGSAEAVLNKLQMKFPLLHTRKEYK